VRIRQQNSLRVSCGSPSEDTWRSTHTVSTSPAWLRIAATSPSLARPPIATTSIQVYHTSRLSRESWKCATTCSTSPCSNLHQGFDLTFVEHSKCRPTTSTERVLVQASSLLSAYSATEQREGELWVALGRHLAQHPHGIGQSGLAPNRSNVPESGTAPNSDNVYPGLTHVEALS